MNAPIGRLDSRQKVLRLQGHGFVADPSGALYWPDEAVLIVADLHLEKGSSYAARRVFLPPYDTAATLARLAEVLARLKPRRVVALGDSFHDGAGASRLRPHDIEALRAMQTGRDWLWIAGNHDPAPQAALDGDHTTHLALGSVWLRHEPSVAPPRRGNRRPSASRGDRRRQSGNGATALLPGGCDALHHAGLRRLCRRSEYSG